ncbi:MAG: polysaccharide biosynthesis protein [Clostridiales bacterium]|nr:polysaccharide biosynthesis protein [Clostridiales bacterium]
MTKKSFMQGAVVLGVAGLFIKVLGAVFRIPLANMIGSVGMSYYQSAYPVYVFFLTLSTAGIPIAISKMVSERVAVDNHNGASKVFGTSFLLLLIIGTASASICFFGAGLITGMMDVPEAAYSMRAIAPALMIVSMMAAFRGYFQGMQNMKLTAVSQSVEQLFRVACGLFLAYYFIGVQLEYAAAGAAFGATAGAAAGLVCVLVIYLSNRKQLVQKIEKAVIHEQERTKDILLRIVVIAVPITIGAAIMPIMNTIDAGMVVRILKSVSYADSEAKGMYGQLAGMVGPLINFPQVLTQAVAMSLVPAVSMAHRQNDTAFMQENIKMGLRAAIIVGLPCAFGFMTLSKQIMLLLYPLQKADAVSAAGCLFIMGIGVIFLSTVQTLTGVLQGIGKQLIPVRNLTIGAAAKFFLSYNLIAVPWINVKGAAVGTVAAYVIASALNMIEVRRHTGVKIDLVLTYAKPMSAAVAMAASVWLANRFFNLFLGNALATVFSVAVGGVAYFFMVFAFNVVTKEEVGRLPKGNKLVKIVNKFVK